MTRYWVEWKDRKGHWHREAAWYERGPAEDAARWFRRDRHCAARVVVEMSP